MEKHIGVLFGLIACSSLVFAGGLESSNQKDWQKDVKEEMAKEQKKKGLASDQIKALQTISLKVEEKDGDLHFSWSPATSKESGGVKIAYSAINPEPVYPFDSHIAWLPGGGLSSHVIKNAQGAAKEARYYRICAIMPDNHSAYSALSNVVKVGPVNASEATQKYLKEKQEAKQKECEMKSSLTKDSSGKETTIKKDSLTKDAASASGKTTSSAAIFCPQCGNKCGSGDNFCSKCGSKLK